MSWFGNICRKFESVCQDVDEVVNHESIQYIERKVQNVGENVMNFYSKLAEVIASPIIDPYISEDEHFVDYPTDMPMPSPLEQPEKNELVHKSVDLEESAFGTFVASECSSTTSSYIEALFASSSSECSSPTSSYIEALLHANPTDVASSPISCNEIVPEMGSNMLPNKAFAVYYNALHNDEIDMNKGYSDYITSHIDSDENYCSSFDSPMGSFGSSDDYISCETTDFNKEANDLPHQVELEESFVIVDYTTPPDDVSSEAPKQPSYKEKMLDALSSKKRLEREYKELAMLQGHNATKCCQETSLPSSPTILLRDSQTIQSSDSEWELL